MVDSQAWDAGSNNFFDFNHWDDIESNDTNLDGIYDTKYVIAGPNVILNSDSHPIVSPFQFIDHPITFPKIISPKSGEFLSGIVKISWTPSYDPSENPIVYSVYYSDNGGESWTLVAYKIDELSTLWDTNDLRVGSAYLVNICAIDIFGDYVNVTSDFLTIYPLQTVKWYDNQLSFTTFAIIWTGFVSFLVGTSSSVLSNRILKRIDSKKEKDNK